MQKTDDLDLIISTLLHEKDDYKRIVVPGDQGGKRRLMRALLNVRPPGPLSSDFLEAQDRELTRQLVEKKTVGIDLSVPSILHSKVRLWQGDITRLEVDAIINAANNALLGCFIPEHNCIDNAIHSAAGAQLRNTCEKLMAEQGFPEPAGHARITKGYNLPARFIIHTVGPIITDDVKNEDIRILGSCYRSCLAIAEENDLESLAFCCISTGEYRFPNRQAAGIAVDTVLKYLTTTPGTSIRTIIFNVFKDQDYDIYNELLNKKY